VSQREPRSNAGRGEGMRRAFAEFLTLPSLVILAFLALAVITHALDQRRPEWLEPLRALLQGHVFSQPAQTDHLLGTVASGVITVTSITFSMLLLAVQQTASMMTQQVVDQFLRRRPNQFYFGYFVGLGIYALAILATINPPFNPVLGGTAALVLTAIGLYMLLLLLYVTLDQMRPPVIVRAIHDHTLAARVRQSELLVRTRRRSRSEGPVLEQIRSVCNGFVVRIDFRALEAALADAGPQMELDLRARIGTYVAYGDLIADVRGCREGDIARIRQAVVGAFRLERQRNLDRDPAYGVEQLVNIAWTSISTAKSNPAPGLLIIHCLRDMLARWVGGLDGGIVAERDGALPIVYQDDLLPEMMDAFETLAVVSSESMQHQSYAAVLNTLAGMLGRLPPELQRRTEDMVRRILSVLGDHVLTADLEEALHTLTQVLADKGCFETAALVSKARQELGASVGRLGSRATRSTARDV